MSNEASGEPKSASLSGRTASPLGLWTLVALVIGNMIGAGVFTTSGLALGDLGSAGLVLAAWLVGGVIALAGALSYGALAHLMPASGGEYLYLSRTIHPLAGFLGGWVSLLAGFTSAIALAALTFVAYAAPDFSDSTKGNAIATLLIVLAALLHGIELKPGALVQNAAVAVKLALIGLFCAFALTVGEPASWPGLANEPLEATIFSLPAFALTLMWVSFSYSGFNAATYLAGEVPEAAAVVPKACLIGTAITMLVYLLLNGIFVLAPPFEAVAFQEDVAAIAARTVGGDNLEVVVRGIIALALFTSVSAMIMVGPRVYAKMADDGLFPAALKIHDRIPAVAIWMQAALAIAVVWIAGLRELLSYLGFTLGLSTAVTVASVFVLARRDPACVRGLWGYPWAQLLYTISMLFFAALAAMQSPLEMLAAIATLVSGALLYGFFSLRRTETQSR